MYIWYAYLEAPLDGDGDMPMAIYSAKVRCMEHAAGRGAAEMKSGAWMAAYTQEKQTYERI